MNDTPETEAAVVASGGDWSPVLRETCRRLERQRDEYYNKAMTNAGLILDARAERDEAREAIRALAEHGESEIQRITKERDEARKELANEMKWHHQTHAELIQAQCKLLDIEYDKLKS